MAYNLVRNARVFFTTNVDTNTGVVAATGFSTTNTREIQVLDGMSFSQNTTSETVTLNEAGAAPTRGQRQFNTSLDPVDFSMSTYMRPADGGTNVTCEESALWGAMFSANGAAAVESTAKLTVSASNSNVHQLQKFGLVFVLDATTFVVDNCVMNTATIDFGLDAIATIQWAGQGSVLRQITSPTIGTGTLTGTLDGSFKQKDTTAPFIANKLSTITLDSGIGSGGTAYTLAITGGSLTISNNVTYLTPANLGVVNKPATYFTGTRAISGTLNCYLKTGSGASAALMSQLLTDSVTDVDPAYNLKISVGGSTSAAIRVDLSMPAVVLSIPTVNTEQVVSTSINFTAQGYTGSEFDLEQANELTIEYYYPNA
jgi:hypothetical protein